VTRFAPDGRCTFAREGDTKLPLVLLAKALGASLEKLENELEAATGPRAVLDEPIDAQLLDAAIHAVAADPRAHNPGRERLPLAVPRYVAQRLDEVATAVGADVGTLIWGVWEWAKPTSYARCKNEAGRARKGPAAKPPPGLELGDQTADVVPVRDAERIELDAWVPPSVSREIYELGSSSARRCNNVPAGSLRRRAIRSFQFATLTLRLGPGPPP
jgi:hypothetical protein